MNVKEENKWIEQLFNCDLSPVLTQDQLELIEAGFPVELNRKINMSEESRKRIKLIIKEALPQ